MTSPNANSQSMEPNQSLHSEAKRLLPSPFPNSATLSKRVTQTSGLADSASPSGMAQDKTSTSTEDLMDDQPQEELPQEETGEEFLGSSGEQDETQPLRPAFGPFFTVIQDVGINGTSHHHPHVHYIFSDDDPDPVTNALLDTLDSTGNSAAVDGRQERGIIIDIAADGHTVTSAKSLSPDWQLISTEVQAAPTFDDDNATNEAGLMLSIAGTARPPVPVETPDPQDVLTRAETATEGDMIAAMEILAEQYAQEMDLLHKWSHLDAPQD